MDLDHSDLYAQSSPTSSDETPETFRPYGVGYVEMPGGVRVETRLQANSPDQLQIGMAMQLDIIPFRTDENGDQKMTFSFSAAQGA